MNMIIKLTSILIMITTMIGSYDHPISHPDLTVGSNAGVEFKYVWDCPYSYEDQEYIKTTAENYGISPYLIFALIEHESKWDSKAISRNGLDKGAMQIREKWHREFMKKLGVNNLLDLRVNVLVGTDLLAELFDENSDIEWVLMAYNGGRAYANRLYHKYKVSAYAQAIIDRAMELEGGF